MHKCKEGSNKTLLQYALGFERGSITAEINLGLAKINFFSQYFKIYLIVLKGFTMF